jgi:single-strand DNA-binding protein
MTITGTIHHIGPVETVGANGFTKRLLVVNNGQQYDNLTPIEFAKDKTALLNGLRVGQSVTVQYDAGRPRIQRHATSQNSGWKVEADQSAPPQPAPVEDGLDLPF